jgi:hypothetical protein
MDQITGMQVVVGLWVLVTIACILMATSRFGAPVVNAWRVIALTLEASVCVPAGIFLIGIGVAIAWLLDDLIGCVIGTVLFYIGGKSLFGALEGFVKSSRRSKLNRER